MKFSAGMIFFTVVAAVTEAIFALCLGNIFDAINMDSINTLVILLGGMIVLIALNTAASIIARSLMFRNASEQARRLKDHVYNVQIAWGRKKNPDIADFTSKVDQLFNSYFMSGQYVFLYAVIFLCSCAAIIYINWIMFFVAFITSAIPFIVPIIFKNKVQKAANAYADESTEYTGFVTDTLYGRLELMKYNAAMKYMEKHQKGNQTFEAKRVKSLTVNYLGEKSTECIGNLMYIAILFAGGILVLKDWITVGNVLSVVQLMNSTVFPITMIVSFVNQINSCKPLYKSLMEGEEFSEPDTAREKKEKQPQSLAAEHVAFRFSSEERAIVEDFSFSFMPGKKYLIKGASGSGKTTLAKLLSGELEPDNGSVRIGDRDISRIPLAERNMLVNYVEQSPYLFKDSVLHNITLYRSSAFPKEKEKEIDEKLQALCLNHVQGSTEITDAGRVSGGERSRICLLRAMEDMPDILIADEPTAALDKENVENVIRYLCSCPQTVIVISHNLGEDLEALFSEVIQL